MSGEDSLPYGTFPVGLVFAAYFISLLLVATELPSRVNAERWTSPDIYFPGKN